MISEQKCNPCLRFILLPMSGLHNPFTKIPSPLRGEGWGGGDQNFSPPLSHPLPPGEGILQ